MEILCKSLLRTARLFIFSFSSLRVEGVRSYDLAREQNIFIDHPARPITIYKIDLVDWTSPYFKINVECSSGTYIRSLIRDIAEEFDTLGTMSDLKRTQCGPLLENQCLHLHANLTLSEIMKFLIL